MTTADLIALVPLLVQAGSVLVLLAVLCVRRNHLLSAIASAIGERDGTRFPSPRLRANATRCR